MSREVCIPNGWRQTTLGELGMYLNGRAFKTSEWSKTGRPIIRIQDLTGSNRNPNYFKGNVEDRYIVRPGDFLISWSATLGAYIWDGPEAVLNQHIFKVESTINKRFHYHLVRERIAELERNAHGSGMVHVTKGIFDNTPVIVPESEISQKKIADRIDHAENFQISAVKHLENARHALDHFRQAALSAAYKKATAAEEGNLVQLEKLLREPFKNGYSARPVNHETPYRVLTLTATTSGWFDDRYFKYTDEVFTPDSPFWLTPGDIVVQRGNTAEFVGVPAIFEGDAGKFLYPDLMIRVRPKTDIDPRYIWYMLLAPEARNYLRDRATGSAGNMPKINQKILANVPIPLPSKRVREEIVNKLDVAFAHFDNVSQHFSMASKCVSKSTQAVLAKAFRGELVIACNINTKVNGT